MHEDYTLYSVCTISLVYNTFLIGSAHCTVQEYITLYTLQNAYHEYIMLCILNWSQHVFKYIFCNSFLKICSIYHTAQEYITWYTLQACCTCLHEYISKKYNTMHI